jgi:hypothetical protein
MMRISLDSPALIAVRSLLAGVTGQPSPRAGRSGRRKASRLHVRGEQLEPRMMLDAGMRAMLPDLVAESDTAPQQINYGLEQGIQVDFRFSDAATSMGNLSADNITSDRTPELTGSVRGGVSQVRLFIDGRRGDL